MSDQEEIVLPAICAKVLRYIQRAGSRGATSSEIGTALFLRSATVAARVRELRLMDRISDSGRKRCGSKRGVGIVWVAK